MTSLKADSSGLPVQLIAKARILAGEPAWPAEAAEEAIGWLEGVGLAVVGVELWRARAGAPMWVASSDYRCDQAADWSRHVESCARGAREFVHRFEREPGALFNLTWAGQDEAGLQ